MRFIATSGYYGTGSSAITDLVSEYDSVINPTNTDFELQFFFGNDGVLKLYNALVVNRLFQEYAIRDFRESCYRVAKIGYKMNYEKYFEGRFIEYSERYLSEIQGDFYADLNPGLDYNHLGGIRLFLFRVVNKIVNVYNVIRNKLVKTDTCDLSIQVFNPRIPIYFYNISKEEFVAATKKYFIDLFKPISEGKDIVMVDGLIQKEVMPWYEVFFDDIRVVLVNRDPRDIFLSLKYVWKSGIVPIKDVHVFCKWYRLSRTMFDAPDCKIVKRIWFEDLIYKYDDTVAELEKFLGLNAEDHVRIKQRLNPEISVKNTKLWEKYTNESDSISIIEKELPEWIYHYE